MIVKSYKRGKRKKFKKQPRTRDYNFLKYYRVVRYYIKKKYDITLMELDMILYLYDMPFFRKEDFNYYGNTMSWDKKRFYEMIKKGLIKEWRPGKEQYAKAKMYELSHKAKSICSLTYKKLLQEETISEKTVSNPIFKKETYMDKVYKNVIEKMNRSKSPSDN
jgi:hypothetical protein